MSNPISRPGPLLIRKYSNRRFYDTSRSCNVTLEDLHSLVGDGWDLKVTDAKTDADITNTILTQLILEHHAPKLAVFPAAVLHQIIRTQQQFLGGVVEQFFRQALEAQRATKEQWAKFLQNTIGFTPPGVATPASSFDWMRAWAPAAATPSTAATPAPSADDEVESLREQLAELARRVQELAREKDNRGD